MKTKGPNSANSNKLILGLWFILFASIVLLTNWLLHQPVTKADKINQKIADLDKQIVQLSAIQAQFLLNFDKRDAFFNAAEDVSEQEAVKTLQNIRVEIQYIEKSRLFSMHADSSSIYAFSEALRQYGANLENLFSASREQGNLNTGLISRWMEISQKMMNVSNPPDKALLDILNQIKQLENKFVLSSEPVILENISSLVEEIRNQLVPDEGGISLEDIDSYMETTANLISVEKRLGHASTKGIIPDLEKSSQKLLSAYDKLKSDNLVRYSKTSATWNILRYAAIGFIVLLCIFLFVNIFSIVGPMRKIAEITGMLADGDFPEITMEDSRIPDVAEIKESLITHVASLQDKYGFTKALNADNLDVDLKITGKSDKLGSELILLQQKIRNAEEKQKAIDQENLKKRYINEGLAKFADILRSNNNDFVALGDAFIKEFVKYLNAIQGGFFIYNDADKSLPVLDLLSAFAFDRKKYLQKSVALGQGLVGTCAKEKQSINLTEIPKGYITITSGLGDTPPDNLLLIPVIHEEEVIGVIEIASLNRFKDYEIAFAEEVAHDLGATIITSRNNQRTAELLAKSQQQALEMTEQEEEMRQNMEELKATQEESGRREEEFRGIAKAIGNTLFVIEYELDGRIREVNEKLCLFLGYHRDEIIGKFHNEVFNSSFSPNTLFWEEVQKSRCVDMTETITLGSKSYTILEHFSPVYNREDIPVKYINFAIHDRVGNS
jgi:PAS domain S-box-containing protein